MSAHDLRYDEDTQTLWIMRADPDPDALVPPEEVASYSAQLRRGVLQDGRPVKRIAYIFVDEDCAEYNHHALAFARLSTYTGSLSAPKPFGQQPPSFDAKDDFGLS